MNEEHCITHLAMKSFDLRLQTFRGWEYGSEARCSAYNLAKTGFYRPNPVTDPGTTRCFACFKELDGWEEDDVPSAEHRSHSQSCMFLQMEEKDWKQMTVKDYILFKLYIEKNMLERNGEKALEKRREEFANLCKMYLPVLDI